MNRSILLRYNFRVLMFNNWWLLVFPLAASQLIVFWNIITQRFAPDIPAQTVEMVSPLLAAFLSAHLLAAEYRSRIGAIIASKPVHIGKVVLLRLTVVLGLVWILAALALLAYYFGMEPYDLLRPALACIPSTLFLAMFALTFATLFRNSLAGFGMAALYWAFDLAPGPPLHPYLSLRTLSFALGPPEMAHSRTFAEPWWIAKIVLLLLAGALYLLHARLLFTLGAPLTMRLRRRALAAAGILFAVYLVSGAALKVGYGYLHRGKLQPDDAAWFRKQFAPYGPLPVAMLFGPGFTRYLGDFPNAWKIQALGDESTSWGDTAQHRRDLHTLVDRMPNSVWAPSGAELLGRLEGVNSVPVDARVRYYRLIVDRYPGSPYLAFALRQVARTYGGENRDAEARAGYEALLARCPGSPFESEALRYLTESDLQKRDFESAQRHADRWASVAPVQERFKACYAQATIANQRGDAAAVRAACERTIAAVQEFRRARTAGTLPGTPGQRVTWESEANAVEGQARSLMQGRAAH